MCSSNKQTKTQPKGYFISRCASICLLTAASTALGNPLNGTIIDGSASIDYGSTTTITQTTDKAIIDWQDFSINGGETTRFIQPNTGSVTLNRVTGDNISNIQGNLLANGQVFLINKNGVLFGADAHVNVAGLVVSTADIANNDFMAGNYHFTNAPVGSYIENNGTITVDQAGLAALVAPSVKNNGLVSAHLGNIVLASGSEYTLDLYGDGLITFDASVLQENGLVENLGQLYADGGQILLTAQATDTVLESVINVDGYIQANTVEDQNKTGTVHIYADTINTTPDTTISASATHYGDGGEIILFANDTLNSAGSYYANAGEYSGDGGFIETSSHNIVNILGGSISASSLTGENGLWYTDPPGEDLTIDNTVASTYSSTLSGGTNITVYFDNVTFTNTSPVFWSSDAVFTVRANNNISWVGDGTPAIIGNNGTSTTTLYADFDNNGSGTISLFGTTLGTADGRYELYYYPSGGYGSATDFSGNIDITGSGSYEAFLLVNNATDLQNVNNNLTSATGIYYQTQNITLSSNFTPLGGAGGSDFQGKYFGNDFTISNLTIDLGTTDDIGLFGSTNGATISAVNLSNVDITGDDNVGGLIGSMTSTTVSGTNSVSGGTIIGNGNNVGGVFGSITSGSITGTVSNTATVTGVDAVGGIVGLMSGGSFSNPLYNLSSSVSGDNNVGGIAGQIEAGVTLANTLFGSTVFVTNTDGGGIVGYNNGGTVQQALSLGTVTGSGNLGALIGNNGGTLTGGLINSSITSSGVGTGTNSGYSALGSSAFTETSTYLSAGFNLDSVWIFTSGSGFYASPRWCGSSCRIALPSNALNSSQTTAVDQVINQNETGNKTVIIVTPGGDINVYNADANGIVSNNVTLTKSQENWIEQNICVDGGTGCLDDPEIQQELGELNNCGGTPS